MPRPKRTKNRAETSTKSIPVAKGRGQPNRWLRRLVVGGALIVILAALAPNLVGWLGLHQPIIDRILGGQPVRVQMASLSLGWFQPITANQIRAVDQEGQAIISIDSIQSSRSLVSLLFNRQDLGEFHLSRPHLAVRSRPGGSNLESVLADWVTDASTNSGRLPTATFHLDDGRVELSGEQSAEVVCSGLRGRVNIGDANGGFVATLESDVQATTHHGRMTVEVHLQAGRDGQLGEEGIIIVNLHQIPAAALEPISERFGDVVKTQGMVDGKMQLDYFEGGAIVRVGIDQFRIVGLALEAPSRMGADRLRLQQLQATGEIEVAPTGLAAREFALSSDVGTVHANGKLSWSAIWEGLTRSTVEPAPLQLNGQVDLARLVAMFPGIVQLHPQVTLESGILHFHVNHVPDFESANASRLAINVNMSKLAGRRGGERLVWEQPLRIAGVLHRSANGFRIDEATIESNFLQATGQADWQAGEFDVRGDLRQLVEQLSQFVDLSGWELAGRLNGRLHWQVDSETIARTAPDQDGIWPIHVQGNLTVNEPIITIPQLGSWRDRGIELTTDSRGAAGPDGFCQLDQSHVSIAVGSERLEMQLNDSVVVQQSPQWNWSARGSGSLKRWFDHLRTIAPLPEIPMDGYLEAVGQLQFRAQSLAVLNLNYAIRQFALDGYGMHVREPEVTGNGNLDFDWSSSLMRVREWTLVSSTVAARVMPLAVSWSPHIALDGEAVFRADMERTLAWWGVRPAERAVIYSGQCEGAIRLTPAREQTMVQIELQSPEITAAQWSRASWQVLLQESQVALTATALFAPGWDRLTIQDAQWRSPSLIAAAAGTVRDLFTEMRIDMTGRWRPDWQRLSALAAGLTGNQVQLVGNDEQTFHIRGPLFVASKENSSSASWPPAELECMAQLGWQRAEVYRLPVGAGALTAKLHAGVLQLETGRVEVSGGLLQVAPTIDLRQPEWVATVAQGRFAREITLTPEICHYWVKYFAPILADVTTTHGRFSMQTGGAQVSIADPTRTAAQGAILLHDVTVGPGPLGRQLMAAVHQVRALIRAGDAAPVRDDAAWIRISEQTVPFTVRDGRIYHSNMEFGIQDFVVKTRGSVGFDQSVSLIAEIPIADRWIEGQPMLAFLKGKTLALPIGGSLSQPRLDNDALQQLLRQIVQPLAANQLQGLIGDQTGRLQERAGEELQRVQEKVREKFDDELRRGLDRLFNPRRDQQ